MAKDSVHTAAPQPPVDLLCIDALCRLIGGTRPVHRSSIYRAIAAGRIPKPIAVGPNSRRWVKSEVDAALQRMVGAER
jgi:predicted DNA-binding transcriptional regulator AlpA